MPEIATNNLKKKETDEHGRNYHRTTQIPQGLKIEMIDTISPTGYDLH
jgi:hypothetical protein